MKTQMLAALMLLSLSSYAQQPKVKLDREAGTFYTTVKTGTGLETPLYFSLIGSVLDSVISDPKPVKRPDLYAPDVTWSTDTLELYLAAKVNIALARVRHKLKNATSMQFPEQVGKLWWNPDHNEYGDFGLTVQFIIQSANGYGNLIYMQASVSEERTELR